MKILAKMKCNTRKEQSWGGKPVVTLGFQCVYDNTIPEDQRFQEATPTGSCEMQIDNPSALAAFELGKDYYLTFEPVGGQ